MAGDKRKKRQDTEAPPHGKAPIESPQRVPSNYASLLWLEGGGGGEALADLAAHRRPEDVGHLLISIGSIIALINLIFALVVILTHGFEINALLPLVAIGSFGLLIVMLGVVLLRRIEKLKMLRRHKVSKENPPQ